MIEQVEGPDWPAYFRAVRNRPPRETLVQALNLFDAQKPAHHQSFAIDLGCGTGIDTLTLLQRGWRVLAVDGQQEAIEHIWQDVPPEMRLGLETRVMTFEEFAEQPWPAADLINASFSLPFCRPQSFDALWGRIVTALRPQGLFAGQLFGPHDTWASNSALTFHSRKEVEALLAPFQVEQFREMDEDGTIATGGKKHWHVYWIVARRRGAE